MHPILVKIGPVTVYSYGVMVALGFGLAAYLASRNAHDFGFQKNDVIDLCIVLLIAGLIGARINYVLLHFQYYRLRPAEVFLINRGGLAFYGSFLFGLLGGILFVKKKKLHFWKLADLMAPFIVLAHAVGRVGCFLNGCCFGKVAREGFPFAVSFPHDGLLRYPVQLYSSSALLVLYLFLRRKQKRRRWDGEVFMFYIMSYAVMRFFVEFLREEPIFMYGLTFPQMMSLILFLSSIVFGITVGKRCKRSPSR